jgi:hypothetical protein
MLARQAQVYVRRVQQIISCLFVNAGTSSVIGNNMVMD